MLEIWGRKTSSNVQALMWAVGELNLPFTRHDIGHRFGGTDTPGFLALNPNGTVPVLRDGDGHTLWETGAILRYLAAQYGSDTFWPVAPSPRANVDKWAEWAKLNVAQTFTVPVFWRVVRTPADQQDPQVIQSAVTTLERSLAIAEAQLVKHDFLAGQDFTLADIQLGHVLYRYYDIAIDRAPMPALRSYYDRLTQRPAYRDHVMISYDELRA
ncbi:glutathione S-transferase family protein [Phaeobacter marinintestinus]|uniref:glutathione S-transferase family protein n=1 Tax=Falsiphaeobacter marinintestinus TaxID=1492905 RepID=UPI0011B5901D|nr:glutathione S-transferase family protein [Phaeobacter marinintestinus]